MILIELEKINKNFKQGGEVIQACSEVSLQVKKGELCIIKGPSGSGKSTLLQLIGGLDNPDSGKILVDGKDISSLNDSAQTKYRQKSIGFVFQNFNLIPTLTAAENVEAAIYPRGKSDRERSKSALKNLSLDSRTGHIPSKLSGGEQQRVAIARSLVNNNEIILADEPTGNLDSKNGKRIIEILSKLCKEEGKTVIVITHSDYGLQYADSVYEMLDGKLKKVK